MFIKFFKSNNPSFLIILPILVVLIWIYVFFQPTYINQDNSGVLFSLIVHLIGWNKYLSALFSVIIVILEVFLIYKISVKYELLQTDTFLSALFYIILMHCTPTLILLHPIIITNLLLLLTIDSVFAVYRQETNLGKIFNAGLFISLSSLFYPSLWILFLIIWLGLIFLRPFIWREWVIALIGFALPYLFLFTVYYVFDISKNIGQFVNFDFRRNPFTYVNYSDIIIFSTVLLILFMALLRMFKNITKQKIKTRRFYGIILWLIVLSIIAGFMLKSLNLHYFAVFSIPLSIIFSDLFLNIKKQWHAEALFLLFLGVIIYGYL